MKSNKVSTALTSALLAFALFLTPLAAMAQTRISMPRNKYKVEDDVKLGQQAAAEAERQFPILNDSYVTNYVQRIGDRLVDAIPQEFDHPQFRYTFRVVNASDINAFALPGGPMYVNRGMITAARSEGEMAGVMAHEIAHVALRHGTAQATKQSGIGTQLGVLGMIIGGAVLGGETGAQLGAIGAQAWLTKYSREYETQSDILGAQIMARAGYDPRDLANMFRTIEQQSGGARAPEFLSSHPNPANRYQRINQEAALLRVSNPIQNSREFQDVQARLGRMPRAATMSEIERSGQRNPSGGTTTAGGTYSRRVEYPSARYRTYNASNLISLSVPENWRQISQGESATFAPEGAYGNEGITHGAMIGVAQGGGNLQTATRNYISELLQSNNYLRQQGGSQRGTIDGRDAIATTLAGRSPVTGQTEVVTIYTTFLRDGSLMYVATVAPQGESGTYNRAFSQIINSLQIND
ncbi:MAG: M48 family metallopeptidase [Acidobacteriota bacterium]|nr:M48 family metallopeptidase [Acidobacteriota bacterium]